MKKIIIVLSVLSIVSLSSCKKTYSCECNSIFTVAGAGSTTETTVDSYSEKMKEKQAKSACSETESKLKKADLSHAEDVEYLTGISTTVNTSCTVK